MRRKMRSKTQKQAKETSGKVRYAVVGLGYISQIAVLPAFAHARSNSVVTALVSSDPKKLKALSRKYRVKNTYSYEQYADCLSSGAIDAVYIGLPNHMHRAYAEAAARAGIHVLCEKPMALDEAECESMIDEAERSNVKLMIAYRLHFESGNLQVIDWISSGKIGEPRIFSSVFSQQVKAGNSRLKADVGGGPLYDMGVYCINAARYLFKAEPEKVMAWHSGGDNGRFAEVPATTSAIMRFPGDRIATFTCSFGASDRSAYEVIGTKGMVKMDPAYEMISTLKAELVKGSRPIRKTFPKRDQFAPELIYFSNCILNNRNPEPSGLEGLADVRVIRAILESAQENRPVAVEQTEIARRPSLRQEIAQPAVTKPPRLVKAEPPAA
jgi:glucose-fructose oxidoreductase